MLSWLAGRSQSAFVLSTEFIREFLTNPRYYRGLFNSVGVGSFVLLFAFAGLSSLRLLGLPLPRGGALLVAYLLGFMALVLGQLRTGSPDLGSALLQYIGYCPLVTLVASVLGVSVAWCLHYSRMPGKRWVWLLVVVPLSTPPFLGALAFKNLLGDYGMVTRAFELLGLSHPFVAQGALSAGLVQAFLFFPLVTLTTVAALKRFDQSLVQAARVQGSTSFFALLTVSLPVLLPGILAGAFLVFVRSFGDFATLKLLLPTRYSMLIVEAYRDYLGGSYWGGAATLSLVMVSVILVLLGLQKYMVEGGGFQTVGGRATAAAPPGVGRPSLWDYGALLYCLSVFAVPLSFLASTALVSVSRNWGAQIAPTQFTLSRYSHILRSFFYDYDSPLVNSFSLSFPALFLCLSLSFLVAYLISRRPGVESQILDLVTVLPFVIPGVAFAVGLIGTFNAEPFRLHSTPYLVMLAYVVTRAPYAIRTILASFQQIGVSIEESSRTLGATEALTTRWVTLPLVSPGILAGAVLVFISCMQDVAITLMIAPPDWYPSSVLVFNSIERGRIYDASAYGILLFLLILVPYALVLFSRGEEGRAEDPVKSAGNRRDAR